MSAVAAWLHETKRTYLRNGTAVRDYRVQLRGTRSIVLFGTYLAILIVVGMVVYGELAADGSITAATAQSRLTEFYQLVMTMLAGIVSLVAPALTATSVVIERQRRSLDLIFSAPVTPKYYLVGKMISSFRYTWMLLILALPVTAACVVLGGASWVDVLVMYVTLSMHGLIFTSIALFMSTICPKPVAAIVWSYVSVMGYLIASAAFVASYSFMSMSRRLDAPFYTAMNPFMLSFNINTHSQVLGWQIPNWIFAILLSAAICRLMLLGAGSLLSARPLKEIKSLRVNVLVALLLVNLYAGWNGGGGDFAAGCALFWTLGPLLLALPFISTYGVDGERRYRPNGIFELRKAFEATPVGGLPYLTVLVLGCGTAMALGMGFGSGSWPGLLYFELVAYTMSFWFFFWALGRYASSMFAGLKTARTLQFGAYVLLVLLPLPLFAVVASTGPTTEGSIWDLYILRPVMSRSTGVEVIVPLFAAGLFVFGTIIAVLAEGNLRRRLSKERLQHERTLAAT